MKVASHPTSQQHCFSSTSLAAAITNAKKANARRIHGHKQQQQHQGMARALPNDFLAENTSSTAELSVPHAQPIAYIAATSADKLPDPSISGSAFPVPSLATVAAGLAAAGLAAAAVKYLLDTPSRTYNANVGDEYDAWTEEGVLEYYWGEHIHLGYYTEEERAKGYLRKNFIQVDMPVSFGM
jgi:hypothetical protein